jgi:hypothetical protein
MQMTTKNLKTCSTSEVIREVTVNWFTNNGKCKKDNVGETTNVGENLG